jgi:hypothetical protein
MDPDLAYAYGMGLMIGGAGGLLLILATVAFTWRDIWR